MAVFAMLYLYIAHYERFTAWLKKKWQSAGGIVLISICTVFIVAVFATAGFLGVKMLTSINTAKDYNGETVVVLGCEVRKSTPSRMLMERIRAAHTFLQEHPDTKCILSGGQGSSENISEAEAMHTWLVNNGIDPARLYLEDQSTSTKENLSFSKKIIEEKVDDIIIESILKGNHKILVKELK